MSERIVVRISRDGRVDAHTEGTVGAACLDVIPLLEDLLDAVVTESRYTRDFYAAAAPESVQSRQADQDGP